MELLTCITFICVSVVFAKVYERLCIHLKRQSWLELVSKYNGNPKRVHGKHYRFKDIVNSRTTGESKTSTAVEQRCESLYFKLTFGVVYPVLLIRLACFQFPLYLGRMVWSKYTRGRYASHTERDIVDCLLSCPSLYMMCKAVDEETIVNIYRSHTSTSNDNKLPGLEDDQAWLFELPEDLPGDAFHGDLQIRHVTIVFLQHRRRILFASHLGVPLDLNASAAAGSSTTLNLLFTIVASSIITWAHVKTHMMSEMSAEEIARGRLDVLEPSARYVDSLHEGLINSPRSPIVEGHVFSANAVTRDTMERRMLHTTPHYLDSRKKDFPAYSFFLQARRAVERRLKEFGFSKAVTTEFLFQNMIVHSIDHYLTHAFLASRPHSIDGSETFRSYIQSFIVYAFWTECKVNLLDDNHLHAIAKRSTDGGFYQRIYNDLKQSDAFLSDKIVVSCSY